MPTLQQPSGGLPVFLSRRSDRRNTHHLSLRQRLIDICRKPGISRIKPFARIPRPAFAPFNGRLFAESGKSGGHMQVITGPNRDQEVLCNLREFFK